MTPPQPSPEGPHPILSSEHDIGVQVPPSPAVGATHLEGAPGPPHRIPSAHVPQLWMMPPHPSPAGPHWIPRSAHVFGRQPPCSPPSPNSKPETGPPSGKSCGAPGGLLDPQAATHAHAAKTNADQRTAPQIDRCILPSRPARRTLSKARGHTPIRFPTSRRELPCRACKGAQRGDMSDARSPPDPRLEAETHTKRARRGGAVCSSVWKIDFGTQRKAQRDAPGAMASGKPTFESGRPWFAISKGRGRQSSDGALSESELPMATAVTTDGNDRGHPPARRCSHLTKSLCCPRRSESFLSKKG
jgi:hypothetical protein